MLYYCCFHQEATTDHIKSYLDVPKTDVEKILHRMMIPIREFNLEHITVDNFNERSSEVRNVLNNQFQNLFNMEEYSNITTIIDGSDFFLGNKVTNNSQWIGSNFTSHKTKKKGLRYQFVMDVGTKTIILTDFGNPAGVHDWRCLFRTNFHMLLNRNDHLLGDAAYRGEYEIDITAVPNKDDDEELYNLLHNLRKEIEIFFGYMKNRFDIMRSSIRYRGASRFHPDIVRLCTSLTNISITQDLITEIEYNEVLAELEDEENITSFEEYLANVEDNRDRVGNLIRIEQDRRQHFILTPNQRESNAFEQRRNRYTPRTQNNNFDFDIDDQNED
jgi:hypothetical protein